MAGIDAAVLREVGEYLGSLASGDLAGNGQQQVLVINRSGTQSTGSSVAFSRAAILEQRGSKWNEVLLCEDPCAPRSSVPDRRFNNLKLHRYTPRG